MIRTPHEWLLADVDADVPAPSTLDALLELVPGAAQVDPALRPPDRRADRGTVTPVWTWVGRLGDDGVEIDDAGGRRIVLGADDLRLIDAIGAGCSVDDLERRLDRNVEDTLEHLCRGGRLMTLHPPALEQHVEALSEEQLPAPAVAPAPVAEGPAAGPGTQRARSTWAARSTSVLQAARRRLSSARTAGRSEPEQARRIPVYAIWPPEVGPMLSLGMLTACARGWEQGRLNHRYEIRRPETMESFLSDIAQRSGPAVLLCSNYIWSLEQNLAAAAEGRALCSELVVIHGGPSAPKYPDDATAFLTTHRLAADVIVRGEGEITLCELLDRLETGGRLHVDADHLDQVEGITFLDPSGRAVRTPDRERLADLDQLPSPYLSGEFDDIGPDAWQYCLSIETNRGCPYGCTFCDWGSATMSRIRKFSMERVVAEFEWAARLGVNTVTITDANFGIMSRDVQFAEEVAAIRQSTGAPHSISWTGAKNTTKHLVRIMDALTGSGITVSTSLSLQTTDPSTLEIIDRSNISTEHYVKLAADFRRRGYPLQGDLMLGLPGQSFESYRDDLQFMLDHEILVRSWPVQLLPNSPMNAPEYRDRHAIAVGDDNLVRSTGTFDEQERRRMWRFRTVDTVTERMAVLRHVMRYLQWDHGIRATELMQRVLDLSDDEPERYPLLSWIVRYFDLFPTVAVGWHSFYDEVRTMVAEQFGLDPRDRGLETVLQVQVALMPLPGRVFPQVDALPHDYVAYYRSATRSLYTSGVASSPERPLQEYGPGRLEVRADPLALCSEGIHPEGDPRSEVMQGDFHVGAAVANELDSDLIRILPALTYHGMDTTPQWLGNLDDVVDGFAGDTEHEDGGVDSVVAVPIPPPGRRG